MVVHNVGQVVGGQVVGTLVEHLVVENVAHYAHIATNDVLYVHLLTWLYLEAYHILLAGVNQALCFLGAEHQRVAHLHAGMGIVLKVLHSLALGGQFLGGVKGYVGLAGIEQLLYILAVNVATLALAVGAMIATKAHTFVKLDAEPLERLYNIVLGSRHKAVGVGVLNAEHHVAAVLARKQIVVKGCAHTANMKWTRGAWCKTHTYFSFRHSCNDNFVIMPQKYCFFRKRPSCGTDAITPSLAIKG